MTSVVLLNLHLLFAVQIGIMILGAIWLVFLVYHLWKNK
jgi:hypothetical protein